MKLTAKYDIEAPVDFVFAQLSDFNGWERSAMRRGADVSRTDKLRHIGPGMTWATAFRYRGKDRYATIRLDALTPTSAMALTGMATLVEASATIDLLDLAAKRTRVEVRLDIKPLTLAAKIYVQSLRLARARVERAFAQRVAQLAVEIEERFRKPVKG